MRFAILAACAAMAACSPPPAERPADPPAPPAVQQRPPTISNPVDVIRPVYDAMLAGNPEPRRADIYTPALLEAWNAYERREQMSVGFDPFINGQDSDFTAVAVDLEESATGRAVVRARFVNFGEPRVVRFDMVHEDAGWRVDNIRGDNPPFDLQQLLAPATPVE